MHFARKCCYFEGFYIHFVSICFNWTCSSLSQNLSSIRLISFLSKSNCSRAIAYKNKWIKIPHRSPSRWSIIIYTSCGYLITSRLRTLLYPHYIQNKTIFHITFCGLKSSVDRKIIAQFPKYYRLCRTLKITPRNRTK